MYDLALAYENNLYYKDHKKALLFVQFVHTLGSEACDNGTTITSNCCILGFFFFLGVVEIQWLGGFEYGFFL